MSDFKKSFFMGVLVTIITFSVNAHSKGCLVANYQFDGNANDTTGISGSMDLLHTKFIDNTLFLNGLYEYDKNGYHAMANINDFSYEAFSISLDFKPISKNAKNIWAGNILTGGKLYRWFGLRYTNNQLDLTLNNQDNIYAFKIKIDANYYHNVIVSFDLNNKIIRTMLDGKFLGIIHLEDNFSLQVINDNVIDENFSFTNYSNGQVFYGYVDNLRIYNCAFSKRKIENIYNTMFAPVVSPLLSQPNSDLVITEKVGVQKGR